MDRRTVQALRLEAKQRGIRVTKKKDQGKGYRSKDDLLGAITKDDKKRKKAARATKTAVVLD
jgi:uncharacterized protein YigE (DUF2233 family)